MIRICLISSVFVVCGSVFAAEPTGLTLDQADSRMRTVYEIAREGNDSNLIDRVLELRDHLKRAFERKDVAAAQRLLRDAEEAVGLDAGGKSMLGQPVGRVDPHLRKKIEAVEAKLVAAMN